jgi:hypothetical protein
LQKNKKKSIKAINTMQDSSDILHIYNEDLYISIPSFDRFTFYKGAYEKKILIVCLQSDQNEANMMTFEKMMASCKLQEADYGLVFINQHEEALEALQQFRPESAILFGLALQNDHVQINKTPYKPFRYHQMRILQSDSLTLLNQKPELKAALWNQGLKVLFNIA